jgi:hypothetical protein
VSERLVASRGVNVNRQMLDVSMSGHADEQSWRVDVRHPVGSATTGTALEGDDNFMCHLIELAVAGAGTAWESLAHGGRCSLTRPGW